MPIRSIPGTDLQYHLVCYDKDGRERREEDGSLLTERIAASLADRGAGITDVFVLSHGWKGDVPAAIDQYDRWIGAMAACTDDAARARDRWPDFRPLLVGFHWPSLPWGDEKVDGSFDAAAGAGEEAFVDDWADRIADTPAARAALHTLFAAALDDVEPDRLSPEVVAAYRTLDREAGLGASGVEAAPDADREPFDPQLAYEDWQLVEEEASFGGGGIVGGMLSPLRQLSFWTMKKRGRHVGEQGGHRLVRSILDAPAAPRLHLMGHSFGCIVTSGMLRGAGSGAAGRPVSSVLLVQGAMSLWSYAADIPHKKGTPGYFHSVVKSGRVTGPIVVTTSKFDSAVGKLYPVAAGAARQVDYDPTNRELPKYGAIGTFGLQGSGFPLENGELAADRGHRYDFSPGHVYNLRSDGIIRNGGGLSGAHSDIAHPELGHAFWSAVLATPDA